jgi:hypothetical protein
LLPWTKTGSPPHSNQPPRDLDFARNGSADGSLAEITSAPAAAGITGAAAG